MKCFRLHEHWTQQGRCWCWCCCRFHLDDNADSNLKSHTINRINTGETSLHGLLFESIFYCSLLLHSQASETLYLFHQKSTCCQNNGITVEKDLEISWIQIWSRHSQNRVLGASLRILLISMWENWWEQYVKGSLLIPSKPPPAPSHHQHHHHLLHGFRTLWVTICQSSKKNHWMMKCLEWSNMLLYKH